MKKQEFLFGIHSVLEAIRAGRRHVYNIHLPPGKLPDRLLHVQNTATAIGIPITLTSADRLTALTQNDRHQGVAAEVSPYETTPQETLREMVNAGPPPPFLLATDGITDPRNLGALIRTALSVGIQAVITPLDRSAPPTPVVSSASAGALEHIRLVQVVNLVRTLQMLKENGVWIFGLDHTARQTCFESDFTAPTALVIGGEGKGIRPLVKKTCDALVAIPQEGRVSSLNASVAGGVVMYEVYRQRSVK